MKKMLKVLIAGIVATSFFVACSDGGTTNNGSQPGNNWFEEPVEPAPENALRNWTAEANKETLDWVIADVEDLEKLIELVNLGDSNGGCSFKDRTVLLINNIKINENVLSSDFKEPEEEGPGEATEGLVNLDSIGRKYDSKDFDAEKNSGLSGEMPFRGVFDGDGHIISGFYSYQGHEGLGFFGCVDGAEIRNLIILDSCIINMNTWAETLGDYGYDGSDDDRFAGLVGLVPDGSAGVIIENCMFVGVVGSDASFNREEQQTAGPKDKNPYEYIGGLIGRNYPQNGFSAATDCFICVKLYKGELLVGKEKAAGDVVLTNVEGVELNAANYARVAGEVAKIRERL